MSGLESTEVLAPGLTKGQARSLESTARRHWRAATRNALVFCAELRRLQDGGAHLVRGFENFAIYAEHTFDGLTVHAAKQLSRQGGVLLSLERHGRLDLDARELPVTTTALRALSVVTNSFDEATMLAVYDRARQLRPGRAIAEPTVKAALGQIVVPALPNPAPPPPVVDDLEESDDGELVDELSESVSELVDRLDILRGHLDDLRLSVEDPILARRELRNVEDELEEVRRAMAIAYNDPPPPHGS